MKNGSTFFLIKHFYFIMQNKNNLIIKNKRDQLKSILKASVIYTQGNSLDLIYAYHSGTNFFGHKLGSSTQNGRKETP